MRSATIVKDDGSTVATLLRQCYGDPQYHGKEPPLDMPLADRTPIAPAITNRMNESRSNIDMASLQEVLDAEADVSNALFSGQNQYFTPPDLAEHCYRHLPAEPPKTIIDPQFGAGDLLKPTCHRYLYRYGVDIDNRAESSFAKVITANCVKFFEVVDDAFPDLTWECAVANPPFGKKWKTSAETVVDSTQATWEWMIRHAAYGFLIANNATLIKLGIPSHPWVYKHDAFPGEDYWKGVKVEIGVVWWKNPSPPPIKPAYQLNIDFDKIREILEEERIARPPYNIYLDARGFLKTYLSTRSEVKLKLEPAARARLFRVSGAHPLALTTEKETRTILRELVERGIYTIQPEARDAIQKALAEVNAIACPIMPVTDFECVAYADEEDVLVCKDNVVTDRYQFTAGRKYPIETGSHTFRQLFTRVKLHFNEDTGATYPEEHECMLSGQDRYIQVCDDRGRVCRFMDRPTNQWEHDERELWNIFHRPEVKTIAETMPDQISHNLAVLRSCEILAGYKYYPGQLNYLSRVAAKDYGLIAAATGSGKTLFAISLLAMKAPERALIIAPQGTMRGNGEDEDDEDGDSDMMNASQWIQEISRFAPYLKVYELFSYSDYERICSLNGGTLPPGVYVSYYQAMFLNGSRETSPVSWDDDKLNKWLKANGFAELPKPNVLGATKRYWCDTIGAEKNGIRCIIEPCLATKIGHLFDMVCLDEAHYCTNLAAHTTQMLIRLQPKYRYAFTATPIPNIVSNLFSLMGWLAVPDWYKGKIRNAAWPYAREELGRFNSTFLSVERDFTEERIKRANDPKWSGTCTKVSPVISAPARLLKLLKPTMAYISKEDCNPAYQPPRVIDVRVPMGQQQAKLYGHFMDRGHIPASHPLVRARKQIAWLRAICADPRGFRHAPEKLKVESNMNPKVIAILELTRNILQQGEQVVIINSRIGLTDTIQERLVEAGVPIARIDSTITPDQHSAQANLFKSGKARVMLMGIKCAAAHSFEQCRHEIIGSIEYSPGPFNQAKGRIDRVNSRPGVTIYCILHKHTIEEIMFDLVATKDDAATICLKGRRVPRDFKPVDAGEILATAYDRFDMTGAKPETECETAWPALRKAIAEARPAC